MGASYWTEFRSDLRLREFGTVLKNNLSFSQRREVGEQVNGRDSYPLGNTVASYNIVYIHDI